MTQNGWTRSASTIAEVAHAAGVSRATVSRVMNGRSTVDPELAARVREVAEQLHYRPSNTARSLSLGRTNTVAVVVPDLANPMFQQVLRGVASAAAEEGYRVLVADTAEHAGRRGAHRPRRPAALRRARAGLPAHARADAARAAPRDPPGGRRQPRRRRHHAHAGHRLRRRHRPDRRAPHRPRATGTCCTWPARTDSASHGARLDALRVAAARREDVRLSERPAGSSVESGYAAAQDVLASRATAVVAYNDLVAFGLLARLNELGVAVPGDVSITGFDDIELARFATPSLTTATVPQAELGRQAWAHLRSLVGGEALDPTPPLIAARPRRSAPAPARCPPPRGSGAARRPTRSGRRCPS